MTQWDACASQKLVHRDCTVINTDEIKLFMQRFADPAGRAG